MIGSPSRQRCIRIVFVSPAAGNSRARRAPATSRSSSTVAISAADGSHDPVAEQQGIGLAREGQGADVDRFGALGNVDSPTRARLQRPFVGAPVAALGRTRGKVVDAGTEHEVDPSRAARFARQESQPYRPGLATGSEAPQPEADVVLLQAVRKRLVGATVDRAPNPQQHDRLAPVRERSPFRLREHVARRTPGKLNGESEQAQELRPRRLPRFHSAGERLSHLSRNSPYDMVDGRTVRSKRSTRSCSSNRMSRT